MPCRYRILCGIAALLLAAAPAGCGRQDHAFVRLSGSSTIAPLAAELAQGWRDDPARAPVTVEAGGSGKGLADLAAGYADVAMVSRPLTPDEGRGRLVVRIADDRIAVIVHRANPVTSLRRDALEAIYRGRITRWDALIPGFDAPVVVIEKAAGRGTHVAFHEALELGEDAVAAAAVVGANAEVIDAVARASGAIGYVSEGMAEAARRAHAPIKIVALAPDLAGRLIRPLLLVTRAHPDARVVTVLQAFCGATARQHIYAWGFVPRADCRAQVDAAIPQQAAAP